MIEVEPSASDEMDLAFIKKQVLRTQSSTEKERCVSAEDSLSNPDLAGVMKSIEDINQACELQGVSLLPMETTDGQVKSKSSESNNKNLQSFEDHGVISLQYPEETESLIADEEVTPATEVF